MKNINKNIEEIKNYFTEDIREGIRKMTDEDMRNYLKELEGTPTWFAILKYSQDRISIIQSSFLTLDPVTDPTKVARYQGAITGILDLQDAVLTLKFESKKSENPKNKEEDKKNELGGAYGMM